MWVSGTSSKPFFDGQSGLVTLLDSNYTHSNHSIFDLVYIADPGLVSFYGGYPTFALSFDHKFESDSSEDGMFIEVSIDGGLNFYNIVDFSSNPAPLTDYMNIYAQIPQHMLHTGDYGFSGNSYVHFDTTSSGWQHVYLYYQFVFPIARGLQTSDGIPDSMIFRFHFVSDSIDTHKNGWMIDNIKARVNDPGTNVSENLGSALEIHVFPNPASTEIQISTPVNTTQISLLSIDGKVLHVLQNQSDNTKIDISALQSGIYFVQVKSQDNTIQIAKFIKN